MKSKIMLLTIFLFFLAQNGYSQSAWEKVNTDLSDKLLKIFFVNPDTGFAIGSNVETKGKIYRTLNGGKNWEITNTNDNYFFLSIYFLNKNTGWIMGYDRTGDWPNWITNVVIYKTSNYGELWDLQYINSITDGPCKIQFVNSNNGWILDRENNCLLKSNDGGDTWQKFNFNLSSRTIVDFYFVNDSVGFCCYQGIFKTTDGGKTWTKKQNALSYCDFHCIQFVNDSVGWAGAHAIYKTVDTGETWIFQKNLGTDSGYNSDWCCFINEKKGWMGSEYITLDGGENWSLYDSGVEYLWNIFFVNENIGYALADGELYKTTRGGIFTSVTKKNSSLSQAFKLMQNYPNPFNPSTTIHFVLQKSEQVSLKIYNLIGQHVATLVDDLRSAGEHQVHWQANALPSGIYFAKLQTSSYNKTIKLILQK